MAYNTSGYPAPYQNGSYMTAPQNSYMQPVQQPMQQPYQTAAQGNAPHFGDWVDGEDAARVYQFPQNWPNDTPLTLWDINDDVFYVKARDSFGRPVPLKKARFTWEQPKSLLPGQSSANQSFDNYATKEDLERLKNDIMASMNSSMRNGGSRE